MYNKADAKSWLDKAKDDLKFAKSGTYDGFYSQSCFIAQQAAEKALKALIYSKEPKMDLREIAERVIDFVETQLKK